MPTVQIRRRPFSPRTEARRTLITKSVAWRERGRANREIALADVVRLFVRSRSGLACFPRGVGHNRTERCHRRVLVDALSRVRARAQTQVLLCIAQSSR